MNIAVAGKGGAGKTTVSGTLARAFGRMGRSVLALDSDTNPMLGIAIGIGAMETDRLTTLRQGLKACEVDGQPFSGGILNTFGSRGPDGVCMVVVSRIDHFKPGWGCDGLFPEQLLGTLGREGDIVISDLEAGVETLARLRPGQADLVLVVAEPTVKSIETARGATQIIEGATPVIIIANRVRDRHDLDAVRRALPGKQLVCVPEDDAVTRADRQGLALIDVDGEAPAVKALSRLASSLAASR